MALTHRPPTASPTLTRTRCSFRTQSRKRSRGSREWGGENKNWQKKGGECHRTSGLLWPGLIQPLRLGIEPRSPTWQAGILTTILTEQWSHHQIWWSPCCIGRNWCICTWPQLSVILTSVLAAQRYTLIPQASSDNHESSHWVLSGYRMAVPQLRWPWLSSLRLASLSRWVRPGRPATDRASDSERVGGSAACRSADDTVRVKVTVTWTSCSALCRGLDSWSVAVDFQVGFEPSCQVG